MDDGEVWAAIDLQRARTADLLDSLAPDDWVTPSLCEGWTVRDVAAHLTLQQITLGQGLLLGLRNPGGVNTIIRKSARRRSALPTERIVAEIRATVGSRRHNVGLTNRETLLDIVVHGQDIAIPLHRQLPTAVGAVVEAANQVVRYQATRSGRRKNKVFKALAADGYRFVATDADWAVGTGPEVRGPVLALLLLLTGRPAGLSRLSGPGVERLSGDLDRRPGAGPAPPEGGPPTAGPGQAG